MDGNYVMFILLAIIPSLNIIYLSEYHVDGSGMRSGCSAQSQNHSARPTLLGLSGPGNHFVELCTAPGNPRPVEGAVEAGVMIESAVNARL